MIIAWRPPRFAPKLCFVHQMFTVSEIHRLGAPPISTSRGARVPCQGKWVPYPAITLLKIVWAGLWSWEWLWLRERLLFRELAAALRILDILLKNRGRLHTTCTDIYSHTCKYHLLIMYTHLCSTVYLILLFLQPGSL